MKQASIAAAFLAVGAVAQNTTTMTQYYNTCTTTAPATVTDTSTETYCPPCEAAGMTTFPGGALTTYVTAFKQVCPTGVEEATYTVTEPCPSTGLPRGPSHIPQGFVETTVPCSVCEEGTSEYAQITPGPALASALASPAAAPAVPTPAAAPPAPAAPAAPGAAPAGAPAAPGAASPANAENAAAAPAAPAAPGAPGAASPAENGAAAPAGSPAGAPAPYPLPSQAGQAAGASGAPAPNSNSTTPFTGTANIVRTGITSLITLATLITGFAFVL